MKGEGGAETGREGDAGAPAGGRAEPKEMKAEARAEMEIPLRVRYAETDAMGFVYYANYLVYFEVARTESLARLGHPYWELEKRGLLIPVLEATCRYRKPAHYGDDLVVRTLRRREGRARIRFDYTVLRGGELLAEGSTVHVFMSRDGRPQRPPAELLAFFPEE